MHRRVVATLFVVAAWLAAWTSPAPAYWTGASGAGAARATTVGGGATPSVAEAGPASTTLSWGASTLTNGRPVDGYIVSRYQAGTGIEASIGAGCAGTIAGRTCTETGIPDGTWRYTVTPLVATHWRGSESAHSGAITVGTTGIALAASVFGAPLPAVTTGTVEGFLPGEAISFELDGTALSAAPGHVGPTGDATISALTIPEVADGAYTIEVLGAESGRAASIGIIVDTTPPVLTPTVQPQPNAAGWNRTPVQVDGSASDGDGSGLSYVKGTIDGSDPRTSPTAGYYEGIPLPLAATTTIKFYGVDLAGNDTDVQTVEVKIDLLPPLITQVDPVDVVGGVYVPPPSPTSQGESYYRGVAAGSFRFRAQVYDDGGSGVASLGTTALTEGSTGFSYDPVVVTQPVGGPFDTNPFSWVAGTTSTPTGTMIVTDAAGNTSVFSGSLYDDSIPPGGGSVGATGLTGSGGRYSRSTTLGVALNPGSDAGSGLATGARLLRASAPLDSSGAVANGACGTYGSFTQVGGDDPGGSVADTVPDDGRCYRYAYAVPDHVGNVATYTSPDIKVEATPPASLTPAGVQITPVTGASAQYVSGSTLYYKPAQSGSFTVAATAGDAFSGITGVDFPTLGGFGGGGSVAAPLSGTTFSTTYNWSSNGASASPGSQPLTATDHAGHVRTSTAAFSAIKDVAGPTHALTLTAASNAYLDTAAGKLYYNNDVAGSFKLVDALADDASGPASVSYPALTSNGWTHATETVSTPTAGPFTSATFSWGVHPTNPPAYTVSGQDNLAQASTRAITFVTDHAEPGGGDIDYANATINVGSVPITLDMGTDNGSGINPASAVVQRDETTLTGTNCGAFPGTFATAVTLVGGGDISVVHGRCYKYRYVVADYVGNQKIYTDGGDTVKVDTTPKVTAIASQEADGSAGDGKLEPGDKLVMTFNVELAPATIPASFSGATEQKALVGNVFLTVPGITNGALDTSSAAYLSGIGAKTATFGGTVALSNAGAATTVTITVTGLGGDTTAASSGTLRFTPASSITGTDGTAAAGTFNTAAAFKLF